MIPHPFHQMADGTLPKSTLQKYIKDALPEGTKIAGEALDLVVQCCNEFVLLLTTQANMISEQGKKNSINPEHVIKALEDLGFDNYLTAVQSAYESFKDDRKLELEKAAKKRSSQQTAGMSREELIELQQKLFSQAKAATLADT